MYNKSMLGLEQCQAAMNAMIAEFKKDPSNPAIAIAIVDDTGNFLSFARTDGCRPLLVRNSINKAYTSAMSGSNTEQYAERLKSRGSSVADMGDPMLFATSGGGVVHKPGDEAILGGIGVAGLPPGPGDQDIALVGLKALNP